MRGERALSIGVTLAAAGAMSLSSENSQAQNAPGIDPFEHANTQGSADCVTQAFQQSATSSEPIAAAMVDSNGNPIRESQICDSATYTNAVAVGEAMRTGLLASDEIPEGMRDSDIFLTFSDRPGTPPQKGEIPARDPDNASGNGGDGDGKPNGETFGKQISQGAEFQAEIPATPTPAAVVENIGSSALNLIATMSELAPGTYDSQIQYALGILGVQNPQNIVEVSMNGDYNFKNRVVYVDGIYYVFDSTQESPLITQTGGTYFDIEEAFGINHYVTITGNPNVRPTPGTGEGNNPLGVAPTGAKLRVTGESEDDPDPNQTRKWIPINWDPDGDGNGEQAYVASDFTNGVEKVISPDAIVRVVTPEQALIESIASFPSYPQMTNFDGTYQVYYSAEYLRTETQLQAFTTDSKPVTSATSYMFNRAFAAADANSNTSQTPSQLGENFALEPFFQYAQPNRSDAQRISGRMVGLRQFVVNFDEFNSILSNFRNEETLLVNHTVLPYIDGHQSRTLALAFFDDSGYLNIVSKPFRTSSEERPSYSSALKIVTDGPGIATIAMSHFLLPATDVAINAYNRPRGNINDLYGYFGCTTTSPCVNGSPAIQGN